MVEQSLNNSHSEDLVKLEKYTNTFVQNEYLYLSVSSPNNFYSVEQEVFKVSSIDSTGVLRVFGAKVLNL